MRSPRGSIPVTIEIYRNGQKLTNCPLTGVDPLPFIRANTRALLVLTSATPSFSVPDCGRWYWRSKRTGEKAASRQKVPMRLTLSSYQRLEYILSPDLSLSKCFHSMWNSQLTNAASIHERIVGLPQECLPNSHGLARSMMASPWPFPFHTDITIQFPKLLPKCLGLSKQHT